MAPAQKLRDNLLRQRGKRGEERGKRKGEGEKKRGGGKEKGRGKRKGEGEGKNFFSCPHKKSMGRQAN